MAHIIIKLFSKLLPLLSLIYLLNNHKNNLYIISNALIKFALIKIFSPLHGKFKILKSLALTNDNSRDLSLILSNYKFFPISYFLSYIIS